jgi:hypothetical protein
LRRAGVRRAACHPAPGPGLCRRACPLQSSPRDLVHNLSLLGLAADSLRFRQRKSKRIKITCWLLPSAE